MANTNGLGICSLVFTNTETSLSEYEDNLPSLPLPPLKQTLQKYLLSVKPFLSDEQYISTEGIVFEFGKGVGQQLQTILEKRAADKRNWLEEWWQNYAYMATREPLIPTSNIASNHPINMDYWPPVEENAMKYGAISIWITIEFFKNIRRGFLQPHQTLRRENLSMYQFHNFFNMCRLPGEEYDYLKSNFKLEKDGVCPDHVIVLCNGHIWTLDPWDKNGEQLQVNELEKQLLFIKNESHAISQGPEIATLTLSDRITWAANRKHFKSIGVRNAKNLNLIESAIFHLVLEDTRPNSLEEVYSDALSGFSGNRWADKTYNIIVYANGYVGMNQEHSPVEAMVSVLMGLYAIELTNDIQEVWIKEEVKSRSVSKPIRLQFDLDDTISRCIEERKEYNILKKNQIDARYYMFTSFGKDWIKLQKFHPDSFVQCAIQLTYYKIHECLAPTYETATTRKFYHGRTETIRSATIEMSDWVTSMMSSRAGVPEKKSKLIEAMKTHLINMRECQNGQGIDRHLLGLYITAIENGFEVPHFFMDPAYHKSGGGGNYVLSTSTVGSSPIVGGVVPMVKDGYAIMYCFLQNRINFTITCFRNCGTCSKRFISTLETSLIQLKDLIEMPISHL